MNMNSLPPAEPYIGLEVPDTLVHGFVPNDCDSYRGRGYYRGRGHGYPMRFPRPRYVDRYPDPYLMQRPRFSKEVPPEKVDKVERAEECEKEEKRSSCIIDLNLDFSYKQYANLAFNMDQADFETLNPGALYSCLQQISTTDLSALIDWLRLHTHGCLAISTLKSNEKDTNISVVYQHGKQSTDLTEKLVHTFVHMKL
jgi:hypothetical protein